MPAVVLAIGSATTACGSLLGIDSGYPLEDAGDDGASLPDAIVQGDGGGGTGDGGGDGGPACTPDTTYCYTHCGPGADDCGHAWQCVDNCPSVNGWSCDPTSNQCACVDTAFSCTGLCGMATDTCGTSHDCGTCDGGGCMQTDTCPTGQACGFAISCGRMIACGGDMGGCKSGTCDVDAGTCCTPVSDPCQDQCNVTVDAGCGIIVACPMECSASQCQTSGGVCECNTNARQCCAVTGCQSAGIDNCDQPNPMCEPEAGAPDGGHPNDGGVCLPSGSSCILGAGELCCSGSCGSVGTAQAAGIMIIEAGFGGTCP